MKQKYIRSYPLTTTWQLRVRQQDKQEKFRKLVLVLVGVLVVGLYLIASRNDFINLALIR